MDEKKITLDDSERTRCEVWTRVMGYHRPTTSFNSGKQSEYKDRVTFNEDIAMKGLDNDTDQCPSTM